MIGGGMMGGGMMGGGMMGGGMSGPMPGVPGGFHIPDYLNYDTMDEYDKVNDFFFMIFVKKFFTKIVIFKLSFICHIFECFAIHVYQSIFVMK